VTWLVIATTLSLGVLAALTTGSPAISRLAKMVASTLVVAFLAIEADPWTAYAACVGVALAASWIGDLSLSFEGKRAFVVGLVAFAGAHIAYVVAFALRDGFSVPWFTVGLGAMAITGVAVLRWLRPHRPAELAVPLAAYVTVIALMVATAFATHGADPDARIPLAAVLFAASDILVARQQFVAPAMANRLIGLPLYFAAQLLFVLSAI